MSIKAITPATTTCKCEVCGKMFERPTSRMRDAKRLFCSVECRNNRPLHKPIKANTNGMLICIDCKAEYPLFIISNGIRKRVNRQRCYTCLPYNDLGGKGPTTISLQCKECNQVFLRATSEMARNENNFCSHNCSSIFQGKQETNRLKVMSLTEYSNYLTGLTTDKNDVSRKTLISYVSRLNRTWNSKLISLPCSVCNYTKHSQLAHIKGIATFPMTATLVEINAPSNIIPLCPNHHWEYDHDLLDTEDKNMITNWIKIRERWLKLHSISITIGIPTIPTIS